MRRDLTDRVIVITGGSSGIGATTAVMCAREGMDVVLAARREPQLKEVAQRIEALGRRALTVVCDVNRDEDVTELMRRAVDHFGRLDVLFANAGYGLFSSILDTSDAQMRAIFETNYFGTLRCIRAAVPIMLGDQANGGGGNGQVSVGDRGHILICSSAVSEIGLPLNGAYCATKAAQDSIGGALRAELHEQGITVSTIHPVGTRTDFFDIAGDPSASNTPDSFMQDPERVAGAIVKCLHKPKPEVWPHWPTRLGMAICTALPGVTASAMRKQLRKMTQ